MWCARRACSARRSSCSRTSRKFGVETSFVSQTDVAAWRAAMRPNTKLLFAETPTNPLTEVCDIARAGRHRAWRRRAAGGGQLLLHARRCSGRWSWAPTWSCIRGTKYLDGQGRVIAGAVCGPAELIDDKLVPMMRSAGMSLSPFNAWVVLKGLETLSIRMQAQSERALQLAQWLETQPQVERVYYPGLPSHPQHALAMAQQGGIGGAVVSFVREGARRRPGASQRLRGDRRHAHLLDHRQPGRHQDHDHAPGQHLARPADRGAAPGRRHHAGHDPPGRGPGRRATTSRPTCSAAWQLS